MDITQAMLDVAFNEGYYGYKMDAKCPYSVLRGDNSALKNAWYRGKYAAQHDEVPTADDLNSYMAGLSRQNAAESAEDDVMVTLRRLEAKLDLIFFKLG
jgi:hypothetical protein